MALEKFPVDESALPRVTISDKTLEEWKEVARDEIERALTNPHSWYNAFKDKIRDGYDMIADKPNLKAFIRAVPNSTDKDILIRSTFENVTLDDIAYGVYSENSYDLRCAFAHMYEENFLDGGILHTHETRTEEDPMRFVGVRWIAFRSPSPKILTSRDFIYFSFEGTMLDHKGERVIYRFLRTMPMDDVPVDSSKLPPLVRGKISNVHLYRQNGSNVEAYVKAMQSNAGSMPSWVATKTIAFMYPGVTNMESVGDARALMRQGLTRLNPSRGSNQSASSFSSSSSSAFSMSGGPRAPSSLASSNACGVCYQKFKMTRSKRQCHGCSRTVCKRCTRSMWFFDEQKQMSSSGVVKLRFCHNCTRNARAELNLSRPPSTPVRSTNNSESSQGVNIDGSRAGSGSSSHSLHRISSQSSMSRTPSHDGSHHSYPRTPSQDSVHSIPRVPSHDSLHHNSLNRIPSQGSMNGVSRGASQASSNFSKTSLSTVSLNKSQPEADFSDEEDIYDDDFSDLHDQSFVQPTQSPPDKGLAKSSSKVMSFKSSSAKPFSSSQIGGSSSTTFDSSQVKNAFEGSPIMSNPLESSHIGHYNNFHIKHAAGDSEEEDEDFGDFHDSDSDDSGDDINDIDDEFDFEPAGGSIGGMGSMGAAANHNGYSGADDYSDAYSVIDSDDYSIAGSFCYEGGPQSFMSELGPGSFSFDDEDIDGSRGSFVPLAMLEQPSIVAQQFSSSGGPRPPAAAPVPQLTQRRLPPQPMTLRNFPPPTVDETSEFDGSSVPPPQVAPPLKKNASRTNSTPNLLAYGATKRTNRPAGAGMAPVRRAVSGTGVIVNGVNHSIQQKKDVDNLSSGFNVRVNINDASDSSAGRKPPQGFHSPGTNSGNSSPMVRYYGS